MLSQKIFNKQIFYLIAILLGFFSGFSNIEFLHIVAKLISDIFINMFKCISLPIITLSIINTISSYEGSSYGVKIFKKTLKYTILTTFLATLVSLSLYLLISPTNISNSHANFTITNNDGYIHYLAKIVPSNLLAAFTEQNVMGVLLIGLAIGVAIRKIEEEKTKLNIISVFHGLQLVFLTITGWIIKVIPVAIFGFVSSAIIEIKSSNEISGLFGYLSVVVLANLVQGFIILPLWLLFNKINPVTTIIGIKEALSVAFFSKSSVGTLPITIENTEKNLKINQKISRFVLPLCTTINMNGCAAFIFTTVIYVMQNNAITINLSTMFMWSIIAVIAAIGNAGVPMGCFFLSASLLSNTSVPIILLGLILPFYGIIDMVETALNVWSDVCVASVINKKINHT